MNFAKMTKSELLKISKPILFNTEMVRAILEGRKTVTRRVIKPTLRDDEYGFNVWYNEVTSNHVVEKYDEDENSFCPTRYVNPPYSVGDILYVRETWCTDEDLADVFEENLTHGFYYRANEIKKEWVNDKDIVEWRPSIHMPKSAARIFLCITDVRVERLQDITEEQVIKEGFRDVFDLETNTMYPEGYYFVQTWNSTIKKQDLDHYGWQANPWVWVIEFERVEC